MPLITCPECKREISSQAPNCPGCGRPTHTKKKTSPVAATVGILGLIVIGIMVVSSVNDESRPKNPVKAKAGVNDYAVFITNEDNFEWPSLTVYLNGNPLDGYKAGPYGPVVPNKQVRIPFTEFVRGDLRFNPYERKVNELIVSVEGHDAPTFKFQ